MSQSKRYSSVAEEPSMTYCQLLPGQINTRRIGPWGRRGQSPTAVNYSTCIRHSFLMFITHPYSQNYAHNVRGMPIWCRGISVQLATCISNEKVNLDMASTVKRENEHTQSAENSSCYASVNDQSIIVRPKASLAPFGWGWTRQVRVAHPLDIRL